MTSMLQQLASDIQLRYPDTIPKVQVTGEEIALLQGQQQVVEYVLTYLKANAKEIDRDEILGDS